MSAAFYPQVQKIYVAYYGRPADPAGLQYWAGQLAANGGNLTSIINAFGASAESTALYAGADNSAKVTAIYQQLFNRAPDAAGLAFYTAELTANRMTASSIALNVANGAQGTDATYLNNKVTVATAFTDSLTVDSAAAVAYTGTTATTAARSLITGVTTSAATTNVASTITSIKAGGGAAAGQTFTLTTDDDSPILTLGNDTITGTSATLSVDDRIVDGSTKDSDTLNLTLTADPPALNARNIEKININWDAFQTLDSDLDDVQSSTITVTSSKVGFGGSANFTNVGENKIVAGAGFNATINADGLEDGSVTASAARTVILGATTAADGTVTVDAPVASTVTITGGDDVSVNAPNATAVTVTSAGADTVNLTLGKTSTVTSTGTTSDVVLRSAAAITVTLADNTAFDTLKADNTISLRLADSSDFSGDEISGAASVRIDDDAGGAFDAELFNVPLVRYTLAQTTGTHTYANGAKLQADVDFGAAMTFATSTSEDSTHDSISLTVKATQTAALTFDTTDRDFETVNLAIDGVGAVTLANVDAGAGTVNLTSNQNVTLTKLDAAELNASTLTKNLTVTQNTAGDLTIVAGSGTNTATFTGTTDDSAYSGGAGNDTVTFVNTKGDASAAVFDGVNSITANAITTGTLAVVGGAGNDTVSATALTTGQAVLNLGAGVNTVTAGAAASGGTYDITGGSGNDAITLTGTTLTITASVGDGVNSLTANTLTTGSATYTGGAGNDTISATAHTTGTLTVTAGDGTNSLTAGTTTGTVIFVGGAGNDTVALASGTTGSFNINVADGSANSVTLTATTGAVTITGGAGVDTVSLTTLTTGTAVIDTGAEADDITVTGTFAAGGSVSVTAGAGNDTITYTTATASGFTTVINGGDGTDTVELGVQAGGTVRDYTDGTITLTGIEIIDIGSSTTDTLVDGDLLNGKSYTIIGDGTATDQLTVHLDTGGTYDFSSIGISATVGTALGGLAIAAQAAATTNSITATAGNDSIDGGTGVDTMVGGGGADTLVGGTGNDVFVLGTTAQTRVTGYATASGAVTAVSVDYFEDFNNSGTDRIQLSSAAGAYGTGLTLSTSATVNIVQVDVTTDCDNLTELVAAVQAASAGVASSSTAVRVYVVSLDAGGDLLDGSFIIVNDGTAALGVTDTIVAVGTTTLSGVVASNFVIV